MSNNALKLKEKYVLGVKINTGFTLESAINYINDVLIKKDTPSLICTTNPEIIVDCAQDPSFKTLINDSSLSLPDGSGVTMAIAYNESLNREWARYGKIAFVTYCFIKGITLGISSFFTPSRLPSKVTGVDLTYKLCELADKNGYSVYFLGGWPRDAMGRNKTGKHELAKDASEVIRKLYPNVHIAGTSSQFSSKESDDMSSVIKIKQDMQLSGVTSLDILIVAYNYNSQEKWLQRNAPKVNAKVCIGVGGTFDYIAGNKKYSPAILRNSNLEWLFRLLTQPWRWRRVSKAFPIFPLKVFLDSISH